LKGAEVVAECAPSLPSSEMTVHGTGMTTEEIIVDPIAVEVLSLEECHGVTRRVNLGSELSKANARSLDLALVRDEFDVDMFDQNLGNEQNVDENDESSSNKRVMMKTSRLCLMYRLPQVAKAMNHMCPS
jgi:hypothetical protein